MERVYVFSMGLRIWHWINFFSILVLFITGLYIGNPFFIGSQGVEATYAYEKSLTMGLIREIHFIAGYILLAGLIFRFLIALSSKRDRMFIPKVWKAEFWFSVIESVKEYLFISSAKDSYPHIRPTTARFAYFLLYIALLFMVMTGFGMYGMSNPEGFWVSLFGWIIPFLGGEFPTHMWHHWVAWLIILFAIVHVYFVVREDFTKKTGEVSSMINGYKVLKGKPVDAEDLE